MGDTVAESVCPEVVVFVEFLLIRSVGHCDRAFFMCVLEFPPVLLAPPPYIFCAIANTLRLNLSSYRYQIWSLCCLSYVVKFIFYVVDSVNAAPLATIADAKFMNAFPISQCFTFLCSRILPPPPFFEFLSVQICFLKTRF